MTANIKTAKLAKAATPAARVPQKFKVMLGNGCKRYVLKNETGGVLYEAAIEYSVSAEERSALFRLKDEDGVRMFYDAEIVKEQMRAKSKKTRRQLAAAGDEEARLQIEQEELDTGAMALRDKDGANVGVRGEDGGVDA